jgi:hypothetical protein
MATEIMKESKDILTYIMVSSGEDPVRVSELHHISLAKLVGIMRDTIKWERQSPAFASNMDKAILAYRSMLRSGNWEYIPPAVVYLNKGTEWESSTT